MRFMVIKCSDDKRYDYVEKKLAQDGHQIVSTPEEAQAVVLPMIATKDGIHISGTDYVLEDFLKRLPEGVVVFGGMAPCPVVDYLYEDSFRNYNAIPTAEGALAEAMTHYPKTIWNSNILVLGCGCVAKHLCSILKTMGAKVTVAARKAQDLAYAHSCGYTPVELEQVETVLGQQDIIFNTIPAEVLSEEQMKQINPSSLVVEIAVGHPCMDKALAEKLGIHVLMVPKMPGTHSPQTAGEIIVNSIYRRAKQQNISL